jgi:GDP-4-dehydro-6-deoxy-D-mannose reductase
MSEVFKTYRPDVTYHLAALTHVGESWDHANEFTRVNVVGTHRVLDAAFDAVPSSTTVVVSRLRCTASCGEEDQPLRETFRVAPANPYSSSKVEAEHVAHDAMRLRGQRVVIARPFNHLGPGQSASFVVPALVTRFSTRASTGAARLWSATCRRVAIFLTCATSCARIDSWREHGLSGEVYNIASGHDVALSDIADQLVTQLAPTVDTRRRSFAASSGGDPCLSRKLRRNSTRRPAGRRRFRCTRHLRTW